MHNVMSNRIFLPHVLPDYLARKHRTIMHRKTEVVESVTPINASYHHLVGGNINNFGMQKATHGPEVTLPVVGKLGIARIHF